jgi:hypothetical protein
MIFVDVTDFKYPKCGPPFSSHKYAKKSALRYEVGLCILTGDIVWINGPLNLHVAETLTSIVTTLAS